MPLDLMYEAPAACPQVDAFEAELASRVDAARLADGDRRRFEVTISPAARGFRGVLQVTGSADGAVGTRETDGTRCENVVRGLAVFVAIALDAAPAEPAPEPAPTRHNTPPPEPSPTPRARAMPPRRPAPSPRPWSFSAGAFATASSSGFGGARALLELARVAERGHLTPALRLSVGALQRTIDLRDGGEARFERLTARLDTCARTRFGIVVPGACATLEAGRVVGSTTNVAVPGRAATSWCAPGLALSVRIEPWRTLAFEIATGPLLPLQRPRFDLAEPGVTVYRPPAVGWSLDLGIVLTARLP